MLKLIQLELRKDNFKKYIWGVVIAAVCLIFLCGLIGSVSENGEKVFDDVKTLFDMGEVMVRSTYIIFAGVLLANIIVGEFKNGTIMNVFVYPIPRKKIMVSKLILVFAFVFSMYLVTQIVVYLSMSLLNPITHMVPETITTAMVAARIPSMITGALLTSGIGLVALFFGMRKKSAVTTIVASVILTSILSSTFGGEPSGNLFSITVIPITLCVIGVGIAAVSFKNINKVDVN